MSATDLRDCVFPGCQQQTVGHEVKVAGTTRDNEAVDVALQLCAKHARVFATAQRKSSVSAIGTVLGAIVAIIDGNNETRAGNRELAEIAGLSRQTVQHAILVLRVLGRVTVRYDSDGQRLIRLT